jgi:hypothetical protein
MIDPASTILIAAPPSPLRSALQALIGSLPGKHTIRLAGHPSAVMESVVKAAPGLVILIAAQPKPWRGLPEAVRLAAPGCRLVVLVDDIWRTPPEYLSADLVLQQGAPPGELIAGLERLLRSPGNT